MVREIHDLFSVLTSGGHFLPINEPHVHFGRKYFGEHLCEIFKNLNSGSEDILTHCLPVMSAHNILQTDWTQIRPDKSRI